MIYRLDVRNRVITHPMNDDIIQGGIESDSISVTFDSEWVGMSSYRAVFVNGDDSIGVLFDLASTVEIEVPWEVLQKQGHLYVSFIAYSGESKRLVTRMMERPFRVAQRGRIEGDESRTPSIDEIQALINAVNSALEDIASATEDANNASGAANVAADSATSAATESTNAAATATSAASAANGAASSASAAATKATKAADAADAARGNADRAEALRVTAESGRVSAETDRVTAEAKRKADFSDMVDSFNGLKTRVLGMDEYDSSGVPTIAGEPGVIYLVEIQGPSDDQYNSYVEWICPSGQWEVIGSTRTTIKPMSTDDIDSVAAGASPSGSDVMDVTRLSYFWAKIKAFFAPKNHASADATYGVSTATNYGHAKASQTTPLANGTASVGSETALFARGDHVHPLQTSVSGNAGTADKLKTAPVIKLGGDMSGSSSFDGSEDITLNATIAALAVETGMLANNSVTTEKIKDGTISTADLADLAITAAKLANGSVTAAKLEAALLKRITDLESAWDSVSQAIQYRSKVLGAWCNFGSVPAYSTAHFTADLRSLGYTAEPQVWFQPYQGAACVSVGSITQNECVLWAYNPTNAAAVISGWLKTCEY